MFIYLHLFFADPEHLVVLFIWQLVLDYLKQCHYKYNYKFGHKWSGRLKKNGCPKRPGYICTNFLRTILKNKLETFQSLKPLWIPWKTVIIDSSLKNKVLEAIFWFDHVTTIPLGMSFTSEDFLSKVLPLEKYRPAYLLDLVFGKITTARRYRNPKLGYYGKVGGRKREKSTW